MLELIWPAQTLADDLRLGEAAICCPVICGGCNVLPADCRHRSRAASVLWSSCARPSLYPQQGPPDYDARHSSWPAALKSGLHGLRGLWLDRPLVAPYRIKKDDHGSDLRTHPGPG